MKIAVRAPRGAVGWFRGCAPQHYLRERGHESVLLARGAGLSDEQLREVARTADVVHVVQPGGPVPPELLEREGALTVDLDDDIWAWLDDPARPLHPADAGPGRKAVTPETIEELVSWLLEADAVTTTTEALAAVIRRRVPGVKKVLVVDNAVPPEAARGLDKPKRCELSANERRRIAAAIARESGMPDIRVVGWTGSVAHLADLPPVLEALRAVMTSPVLPFGVAVRSLGRIDFSKTPEWKRAPAWRALYSPFFATDGKTITPEVPFEKYYDALELMDPDVALVPLRDSPFGACKSAVTLYSWGIQRVPVVCSRFGPYAEAERRGFPAVYVEHGNVDAWKAALQDLLLDPVRCMALGRAASAWVLEHASWPNAAAWWERAFDEARAVASTA